MISDLLIPATAALLDGWCGPILWRSGPDSPWRFGVWGPVGPSSGSPTWGIVTSTDGHDSQYEKVLDPTRPEVVDHLIRLGAPRSALDLSPAECAAVVALWAAGVTAPVLPPWVADGDRWVRWNIVGLEAMSAVSRRGWVHSIDGWADEERGPETGAAGRDKADAAALAAGRILHNGDHLLLPWPGGVRRVELENA